MKVIDEADVGTKAEVEVAAEVQPNVESEKEKAETEYKIGAVAEATTAAKLGSAAEAQAVTEATAEVEANAVSNAVVEDKGKEAYLDAEVEAISELNAEAELGAELKFECDVVTATKARAEETEMRDNGADSFSAVESPMQGEVHDSSGNVTIPKVSKPDDQLGKNLLVEQHDDLLTDSESRCNSDSSSKVKKELRAEDPLHGSASFTPSKEKFKNSAKQLSSPDGQAVLFQSPFVDIRDVYESTEPESILLASPALKKTGSFYTYEVNPAFQGVCRGSDVAIKQLNSASEDEH